RVRRHPLGDLRLLRVPRSVERRICEVRVQEQLHVRRLGGLERRDQNGAEECLDVEMARRAENANRFLPRARRDLSDMARRAIDSHGGLATEMFNLGFSAEPDWPAELRIGNQTEIREIRRWK